MAIIDSEIYSAPKHLGPSIEGYAIPGVEKFHGVTKQELLNAFRRRGLLDLPSTTGLAVVDRLGRIEAGNAALERILGFRREFLHPIQLNPFHESNSPDLESTLLQTPGAPIQQEIPNPNPLRSDILQVSFSIVSHPDGTNSILAEVLDITLQRKREQDLKDLLDHIVSLFAVAAHDIKSPMTAISGFAQMIKRQLQQAGTNPNALGNIAKYTDTILSGTNRASERINDALKSTKDIHDDLSGKKEPLSIVLDYFSADKTELLGNQGVTIEITGPTQEIQIPTGLRNILNVLVDNATEAMQTNQEGQERLIKSNLDNHHWSRYLYTIQN